MIRALLLVLALAAAFAACDRVVDLAPAPDAQRRDGGPRFDAFFPDGVPNDGGGILHDGPLPDAFVPKD